jgi:hypothetical protein
MALLVWDHVIAKLHGQSCMDFAMNPTLANRLSMEYS